jgi:hypothetical protein
LLTDVPGTASNLPFVHTGVAAERSPRRGDHSAAPPANRFPCIVSVGLTPLIRGHDSRPTSAHDAGYRANPRAPLVADCSSSPHFRPGHALRHAVIANLWLPPVV